MGYLTNYKISFIHFGKTEMPKETDIVNALNSINPYDFEVGEDETPLLERFFEEPIKWYDHIEDMIKLSKVFPETLFILDGWGEELGDVWRELYMDGERVRADLIFSFSDFKVMNKPEHESKILRKVLVRTPDMPSDIYVASPRDIW